MISTSISTESSEQISRLKDSQAILAAVAEAMAEQNALTVSHIQRDYLSYPKDGPPVKLGLRVQSNRLRPANFASDPVIVGQRVVSGIGNSVAYAAVHEFGATIPAHTVTATNAKALRFMIGQRVVFAKSARIPNITIPARAPIQHGIQDRIQDYGQAISEAIEKASK